MDAHLISKLSDRANPGTVSVWWAAGGAVLVLLLVWRCLLPQGRALLQSWRDRRRHQSAMLAWRQKGREGDPPGR